jgi:protein SCO1/2
MQKKSTIWVFVILVFLVPIVAYAGYIFYEKKFQKLPVYGKESLLKGKKVDHEIPAFELINQDGKISTIHEWNNKIVIVDFFFTHCPSICPKMTTSLKKVQKAFAENEILISSFSVDPEKDNTEQLKWYSGKFGINTANWQLLTGDKKDIYKLARNGFMIVATDGDGGPNDFIHSEKLVLVDKQKRIRGYYDGTSEKEINQLIKDIKKLKDEN